MGVSSARSEENKGLLQMKRVYCVRHGFTQGNAVRAYQLPTIPLSDQGKARMRQVTDTRAVWGSPRGYGQNGMRACYNSAWQREPITL
jgi:hypothetical protein